MSRINNPDNELMVNQQENDLHHPERSQPDWIRSGEGTGLAAGSGGMDETERALERARQRAREQGRIGRRRRVP